MRLAVLGASGFIGREVVRQATLDGSIEIIAGIRSTAPQAPEPRIDWRRFDARNRDSVAAALAGATHVVDCTMGSARTLRTATRHTLEAALSGKVERLVHLSSIAVFGGQEGRITEAAPFGHDLDWYGTAKAEGEAMVRAATAQGLDAVILRPALVYGLGSPLWTTRIAALLRARRLGDLGALGDGRCNLVHVGDVAGAILRSLQLPGLCGEVFNLDDPDPPTWNAYLMHFARALGATPVRRIPRFQLALERRAFAAPLRAAEGLLARTGSGATVPPPITPGLARRFERMAVYDSGHAEALFPRPRVPWQVGVEDVARQLR